MVKPSTFAVLRLIASFILHRRLDREVGRLLAPEDAVDVDADKLETATDYAASMIAKRQRSDEVAGKIQAHVIVAAV